ncbi:MAG: hypothetical protein JNK23_22030 [Opitutaceae bacterium]|nr:hypothetical protein [Opitutaceae bacterium]
MLPLFARALCFHGSLLVCLSLPAGAAAPEWKDPKGATFRGEPIEVVGPVAVFRTGGTTSKFLPLSGLSPEDCRRFHAAISGRAPRAEAWAEAKGEATAELVGKLRRSEQGKLVAVDFAKTPEPELIVGVFVGKREGGVRHLLDNLGPFVSRVQRVYPGRAATIVFPSTSEAMGGGSLPARSWLVAEAGKASGTKVYRRFGTMQGMACVLLTREGVPLFGHAINEVADLMKFVDGASNFLWDLNPANPRTARDRAHYLGSVRPVEYADSAAPPVLLVDPLRVDALRIRGVTRVEAVIDVGPNGWPTGVTLAPDGVPEPLRPVIAEALKRGAIFSPAVERGAGAPGRHAYALAIPPENKQHAADAAWVNGEARRDVPFKSWLVLKPIRVPEQVFTSVDRVGPDGIVMLKAVTAGKAGSVSNASQMNAFNSDWFTDAGGPASVRPVAGQKQDVDDAKLTWRAVKPQDGLVDFLGGASYNSHDYCVGYAWTEVEVPEATDAWLGIGSDDGLKVWLNGELVNDKWQQRTSRLDDEVVPLRLKKGANHFLIKIQNAKGLWSFTARLRTRGN